MPTPDPLELPAYVAASSELAGEMVPMPDDFVETLSPHAAILFARQTAMAVAKVCLGATISLGGEATEDDGTPGEILRGILTAVAGTTHACVALGILPPEAEGELADAGESVS